MTSMLLALAIIYRQLQTDFPGGSDSKAFAYNAGDQGSIPGSGRSSGERNGNPFCLEYSASSILPGESHEQRSLVGYSPWGHKESDTTEQLHFTSQTATKSTSLLR